MKPDSFQCVFFAVLNIVSGVQSDQCGVDLLQLAIDIQDVSAVILEGTATVTYTVFEKELGPPPPELGIVIPPPRNVSFQSPDSMPIVPSSSASSSSTSSSASTVISTVPKSSPTLIANVNTLLLEFVYSPDGPECSIIPDASGRGTAERRKRYVSSTGSPLNIRFLYETLSKALNITISKLQYNEFSSAIIEIAEEYLKACKASIRTSTTIYTLYDQLLEVRQSSASNKANLLRSILAKTLCSHTKNKRQSAGKPNSTDFFRSITDFEARNIFGFNFYEWSHRRFPTLAFVVDTTGSMANAIAGVRQAIKSIIALEQQNPFFYVLTPFNDYDGDTTYRNVSNYGPNYIATTRSDFGDPYRELKNLYSVVSNLTADSGGDKPEYCMGGILEALRASRQVYCTTQTVMHYAVTFFDSKFSISENLPSVCTKGMVAVNILDDNAEFISSNEWFGLDLLNHDNVLLTTVSLVNCSGTYLGNVTYPEGIVTSLRLRGRDYLGYEFQYQRNTSSQLSFSVNPCKSLTLVPGQSSGVVTSGESRIFSFFISVIASTTPTEVRISTLSNSDKISNLVLMNGFVISSNAIATVRVNVSVSTLSNGTATVSFTIQAHCGCNVNDAYEQVFQISSVMGAPTDQCGGCLNGGTCVYLFGRYFCSCPPPFIGTYCQTSCPKLNMTITLDNLNMIITLDNLNMTITLDNLNMTITLDNLTITLDNLNMTIIHDSLPQSGKSDVVMFSFRQQVLYTI
eukprot:Em0008g1290a